MVVWLDFNLSCVKIKYINSSIPSGGSKKCDCYTQIYKATTWVIYYQVDVANKNETPVAREVQAMNDIFNATGGPVVFRPYKWQ